MCKFVSPDQRRGFVNYEDYIRDWRGSLGGAFRQLDISPVRCFERAAEDVENFIAKGKPRKPAEVCAMPDTKSLAESEERPWKSVAHVRKSPSRAEVPEPAFSE